MSKRSTTAEKEERMDDAQSEGFEVPSPAKEAPEVSKVTVPPAATPGSGAVAAEADDGDAEPVPSPAKEAPEEALPKCLKRSIELLQAAELLPNDSPKQQRERAAAVKRLQAHVFSLQQDLPVLAMDANAMIEANKNQAEQVEVFRLEQACKAFPVVRDLMKGYKAAMERIATLEGLLKKSGNK